MGISQTELTNQMEKAFLTERSEKTLEIRKKTRQNSDKK